MEEIINQLTTLPTLPFFAITSILSVLLIASILGGLDMDLGFDVDVDIDIDNGGTHGFFVDFFITRGLTKIPLVMSLFILFTIGLIITYNIQWSLLPSLGITMFNDPNILFKAIGLFLFIPITIISAYIASPIISVLEPILRNEEKQKPINFIGHNCEVITLEVTDKFGEAEVEIGDKKYILNVVSSDQLKRHDKAEIIGQVENSTDYIIKKI